MLLNGSFETQLKMTSFFIHSILFQKNKANIQLKIKIYTVLSLIKDIIKNINIYGIEYIHYEHVLWLIY
jgi:hypothetical protein